MLTNKDFVNFIIKAYESGYVYWYGTYGRKCTESLYKSKKKQYPSHYGSSRTSKYMKHIAENRTCADCIGLAKNFVWCNGEFGTTPKYAVNGMPDKSANGMFEYAKKNKLPYGKISTIPEIPGVAVRYSGHVGYYIGNGWVIEERGFNYGCVKTKLAGRGWTDWYYLPGIHYSNESFELGWRELKNGSKGDDVKDLQEQLIHLGYNLGRWGADGDFGDQTEIAVYQFQEEHGLKISGKVDSNFVEILRNAIIEFDKPVVQPKFVKIVNGQCYVRSMPNTSGDKLGVAKENSQYEFKNDISDNGWLKIDFNGQEGWVSGKYSKLLEE